MILLKTLIVLLLCLIVAHIVKMGWQNKDWEREAFQNNSYLDSESTVSQREAVPQRASNIGGGEMAAPVGTGQLAPSQKKQAEAKNKQQTEEDQTIGNHKEAAFDMNNIKKMMDDLTNLSDQAQSINMDGN
jgi:hypothetical protein